MTYSAKVAPRRCPKEFSNNSSISALELLLANSISFILPQFCSVLVIAGRSTLEASVLRSKTNDRFIFLVRCVWFLDSFALSRSSEDIFQFLPRQDRTHSQLATGSISVSFYSEQARCTWICFCPWETKQILNLSQISHRPKGNTAERPFVMIPTIISLRCIRTKLV